MDYPQVTHDQLDYWLELPVTKAYLQGLEFHLEEVIESRGKGAFIDSSNSDLTFSCLHIGMGQEQGLESAIDYTTVLTRFGLLEEEKEEAA